MSYEHVPEKRSDVGRSIARVIESIALSEQDRGFLDGIIAFAEARRQKYDAEKVSFEYFEEYDKFFPIVRSMHLQRFAAKYMGGAPHRRAQASRFINGLFRAGYAPIMFGHELRPQAINEELGKYFRYRVNHYDNQFPVYEPVLKAENIQELAQQDELLLSCRNIGPDGVEFFKRFCADVMLKDMKPEHTLK